MAGQRRMGPGKIATAARYYRRRAVDMRAEDRPDDAAKALENARRYEDVLDALTRCRRCGAPLTDPLSVARKVGPDCFQTDEGRAAASSARADRAAS